LPFYLKLEFALEVMMAIAFVDGTVVVGDGRVLEHTTVFVEDERIIKVAEGNIKIAKGARTIPMDGQVLLPVFIDSHVHLCLDASPDPMTSALSESPTITAFKAANSAKQTLLAGVTSVRDMGGKDGIDLGLRQAIHCGLIPGPRMLATEEELRAGVEEAHKAGKRTATHAMGTKGIVNALRAGIDSIEHGVYLDDQTVALMKEKEIPLIPTCSAFLNILSKGTEAGIPAFAVEKTLKIKPFHLESIRMARDAGVRIAMGTDAGTPFNRHGKNLGELIFLVDCGFSPMEAIKAGTGIAAQVLGLDRQLGTVEEGKLADLVLVAGNPLEDIRILLKRESIRLVMKNGKQVSGKFL
jgi:imidazolonepropionase-like amidohydrolase